MYGCMYYLNQQGHSHVTHVVKPNFHWFAINCMMKLMDLLVNRMVMVCLRVLLVLFHPFPHCYHHAHSFPFPIDSISPTFSSFSIHTTSPSPFTYSTDSISPTSFSYHLSPNKYTHPSTTPLTNNKDMNKPLATKSISSTSPKPCKFNMQGYCHYRKKALVAHTHILQCASSSLRVVSKG